MKKIFHSLLVLLCTAALLCAATLPAFAEGAPTNGSITINNATKGETYDIYRIFDLESYTADGKYSYTLSEKWADAGFGNAEAFTTYFDLTGGYVHPKTTYTETTAAEFAVKALAFATEKSIGSEDGKTATGSSVSFSNLRLGYYLVDTSLGTLCSLDTTNPNATIIEKNTAPTIDKKILSNNTEVIENNATIGSKINYQVTIHAKKGATGYILTDTLSAGLTLDQNSIAVKKGDGTTITAGVDTYSVTEATDHKLVITFHQALLDTMTNTTDIVVTYSATLNKDAVIHNDVNKNTVKLEYGKSGETTEQSTKTHTYKFDLVKTDASNTLLAEAKFKLYDSDEGGNEIKLTKVDEHTYRPAVNGEPGDAIVTKGDKVITIQGLANGTYWLEEIQQPTGYNKLTERKSVKLENGNNTATMNDKTYVSGGLHIVNQSGTVLPGTGGMGTTLFYVVGGGLMVAAFVLLVAKKRMENKD